MNTPLAPVFAGHDPEDLPLAFREQFLATPERQYEVVLEGVMHEIRHLPYGSVPASMMEFTIVSKIGR